MIDYKKIIKDQELRLKIINRLAFIPTPIYLKLVYWIKTGKRLELDNPIGFCDKLNWLKLHNINDTYTNFVDKIEVRNIVNKIIGEDICFPILGHWEKFEDIDFSTLPNKFVLKCNHDSASVTVVKDKSSLNLKKLKKFYNGRLKISPYNMGREYPYKNVKPRILAEQYMTPDGENDINDYKFFCFHGEPKIMFIATDRSTDVKFDFFDMDFNHLPIYNIHPNSEKEIKKPHLFDEMKALAAKLSKNIPFVRIDLYEIKGKIYFGEYTFFHGGGFWPFYPEEWENKLGEWLHIYEH